MKICIIGENSKIGKSLIKHLPKGYKLVTITDNPDYVCLATSSEKAKKLFEQYQTKFKIIDFSGSFKLEAIANLKPFSYAFAPLYNKNHSHIVFPGCSSLAVLTALYPLRDVIKSDSIFADVKFSKSAMQYKSDRQKSILTNQVETVNPFNHFHEKEINQVLSPLKIKIVPSVINISQGLFVNIFFNIEKNVSVEKLLKSYYKKDFDIIFNSSLPDVLDTNKTNFTVVQDERRVCITVITDNLVNGKVFSYLK